MKSLYPTDHDIYLFHQGNLFYSYQMMGAHLIETDEFQGVRFTVWAPNAKKVSIVGDFNDWNGKNHPMEKINEAGIWVCFIPNLQAGTLYKYEIHTYDNRILLKSDPYAFFSELRPNTASIVYPLDDYEWNDAKWQKQKQQTNLYEKPIHIYEVHFGSWKKKVDNGFYSYRELADELIDYVLEMGFTHIEILPLSEHPFDRSWGYQTTGYFSITSRYGTPNDFKYFVDRCHQQGIGVIIDWVPGHFCKDDHGLREFDGRPLYEYENPHKAEKHEWGTLSFDFGRNEVQSFLISNALFWLDVYHIDGIRVDAVASMLYLDFGKEELTWLRNEYGGRENIEAVQFIKKMNEAVFQFYPNTLMMAEESTAWPLVSSPTYLGGLGFNYKWNMGWMNDMLKYMEMDPIHRKWHHNLITFSLLYAFSENFVLPLSHDEVVHGKKSLLNKMPGDYWQKFANLRVFLGYMMTHPGKKLLFMGGEFGQFDEWKDLEDLDWELLNFEMHQKMHQYVKELNHFYLDEKSLWQLDHQEEGFEWIDPDNNEQSIITFIRKAKRKNDYTIILCNFTPKYYADYSIGVPEKGKYIEVFNSDHTKFGGSGKQNNKPIKTIRENYHNQPFKINIQIPPLSMIVFKKVREEKQEVSSDEK